MTITVLVADDQHLVRAGFSAILDRDDDFEVVAQCSDGVEAVEAATRLRPQVALLDIRMPRLSGLDATRHIVDAGIGTRVVIVTTFDSDEYLRTAIANGASGFLLKDAEPDLLKDAVRAAAAGDALVSPALTVRLLQNFAREARASPQPSRDLSQRELEVARLVAEGLSNAEICGELFVSLGTVKTHLANIQSKLGMRNRVEIASWAWRSGFMDDPAEAVR